MKHTAIKLLSRNHVDPCHHGAALLRVAAGGDGLQMWRAAANILNESWTADKVWSSRLGIGRSANSSP